MLSTMKIKMSDLEKAISFADQCEQGVYETAVLWRDEVFTKMNLLRKIADTIEEHVDEKYWPMPTYVDLLFGI